jgi:thiamine-phosphate pyrophosphorylase
MKKYLITDRAFYKYGFKKTLTHIYKNFDITYSSFRDKESTNFKEYFNIFLETSREFGIKNILINSHIDLAIEHNIGVHLTSKQFDRIKECKEKKIFTIASTHSIDEIELAKESNIITFSPIFQTPNKGKPLGVERLKEICDRYSNLKIFALGGVISDKEVEKLYYSNCYGFASIRYFLKDFQ